MRKKQTEVKPVNNSFIQLLASLRDGEHAADASLALERLVKAVRETVLRGKVVVTVELVPMDEEGATVKAFVRVDEKLPKPERKASVLYTTKDGRLMRDNPDQLKMKLSVVNGNTEPTATAAEAKVGR